MNERIKLLRKDKSLSRAAFGEKLGVSGDVINNLERGRVEPKEHIIKLICSEFSVNENWLRNGIGEMYIQPDTFSLDDFIKENGASELELEILKAYFELDIEIRQKAINYFKGKIFGTNNTLISQENVSDSIKDAEASYIKRRSASAQKMTSSALNTTNENGKTKVSNQ